jgi:hypothetical protein
MQVMDREQDDKECSYARPLDLNGRYCSLLFREFWALIVRRGDGPWSSDCWNVQNNFAAQPMVIGGLKVEHEYEGMKPNGKSLLRLLMCCLLATLDAMHILCYCLQILIRAFRVCWSFILTQKRNCDSDHRLQNSVYRDRIMKEKDRSGMV